MSFACATKALYLSSMIVLFDDSLLDMATGSDGTFEAMTALCCPDAPNEQKRNQSMPTSRLIVSGRTMIALDMARCRQESE